MSTVKKKELIENRHYILDGQGLMIFTKQYHLERGYCCGNKCRYCPYEPKYSKGETKIK